jgi:hypothetical protein
MRSHLVNIHSCTYTDYRHMKITELSISTERCHKIWSTVNSTDYLKVIKYDKKHRWYTIWCHRFDVISMNMQLYVECHCHTEQITADNIHQGIYVCRNYRFHSRSETRQNELEFCVLCSMWVAHVEIQSLKWSFIGVHNDDVFHL